MTKLEIYNYICDLSPDEFLKQEQIATYVKEIYSLIEKEIKRKDRNIFQIETMFNSLIDYCIKIGIVITINTISDKLALSNIDYDLFIDIKQKIEIDLHNFKNIINRPTFLIQQRACNRLWLHYWQRIFAAVTLHLCKINFRFYHLIHNGFLI